RIRRVLALIELHGRASAALRRQVVRADRQLIVGPRRQRRVPDAAAGARLPDRAAIEAVEERGVRDEHRVAHVGQRRPAGREPRDFEREALGALRAGGWTEPLTEERAQIPEEPRDDLAIAVRGAPALAEIHVGPATSADRELSLALHG